MNRPGAGFRLTSSILLAPVLGIFTMSLGIAAFFLIMPTSFNEHLIYPFLIATFLLGPLLMWAVHRFYHQTIVLYIIILVFAVPTTIIGLIAGFFSMSTLSNIDTSEVPGPSQEGAFLGQLTFIFMAISGFLIFVLGLLGLLSAIFGLKAHGKRARATDPL